MKIYVQRMLLCHNTSELKAICSITLNDEFNINNVRIVKTSDKRLLVVMPGKLDSQGKFFDLAHPIKREVRQDLEKVVLEEYKRMTSNEQNQIESHNKDYIEKHYRYGLPNNLVYNPNRKIGEPSQSIWLKFLKDKSISIDDYNLLLKQNYLEAYNLHLDFCFKYNIPTTID